eukprot:CAMPEP_0184367394 /NCGR_PEP_ID=MMETSP1089-20130417/158144_1 /TAXON_ID=38269 ORGANISM="Gloeochaete wittrockiana, Strain SAG46.84" /NCGR_SAMPLE_ID=MMETSP1089 /ASSEMBLY_ACC=CAM_ASM_000445 /LENGTH=45 /DNA_ID= /DNA_START= /DNA_END= /DNA_ORIENTATION=
MVGRNDEIEVTRKEGRKHRERRERKDETRGMKRKGEKVVKDKDTD